MEKYGEQRNVVLDISKVFDQVCYKGLLNTISRWTIQQALPLDSEVPVGTLYPCSLGWHCIQTISCQCYCISGDGTITNSIVAY